jgi:Tat protein secretion system quality control protein TatD with DNase activity
MHATIVDSHCHLDFPDFDSERPDVIARAIDAGVERMVTICTRLRNEPAVRAIAEAYAPVFYAAGTHPMNVVDEPMANVDELIAMAGHPWWASHRVCSDHAVRSIPAPCTRTTTGPLSPISRPPVAAEM